MLCYYVLNVLCSSIIRRDYLCKAHSSELAFPPRMAVNPVIRPIFNRNPDFLPDISDDISDDFVVVSVNLAFGCPDVQAPDGGWIKRQDNTVVFGCSDNRDKWQLRCQGVTWVGDRKNCSKGAYSVTLLEYLIVRMIRVTFS